MQKAEDFFNKSGIKNHKIQRVVSANGIDSEKTIENAPYYIFNASGKNGFVIIAGDDRVPGILGYSDTGSLNEDDIPCNMQWMLDYYRDAISNLPQNYVPARKASQSPKNDILPMIKTKWGQGYNDKCPEINGIKCPTGCVATAMAQVVNYNRWPIKKVMSVSPYSYINDNGETVNLPGLPPTTFAWDNMTDASIAELMQYCGYSLKTDYELSGSGALMSNVLPALTGVFGFSGDVRDVYRNSFSDKEWLNMAYNELSLGRPLIYEGFGNEGHCFIVDGYSSENDLFHVNWGWYGSGDGYFSFDNLIVGGSNFNYNQGMILNVYPPEKFDAEKSVLEYEILTEDFVANIKGYKGAPENIEVPSVIRIEDQSYKVAGFKERVFAGCESLKSIQLPYSLSSIDDYAFQNCKNLSLIELPDGLVSIGEYAFENCTGMTGYLKIPNTVMQIKKGAFKGCGMLSILGFNDDGKMLKKELGEQAFMNCTGLEVVYWIQNVFTEIKEETFKGCGLLKFSCPSSLTKIGNSAFEGCDELQTIEIYDNVKEIGDNALAGCTSLNTLHCEAMIPPVCGNAVFDGIDKSKCKLNVPASSISAYKKADKWCDFNPVCEELKYVKKSDDEVKVSGYYFNPVDVIVPDQTEIDGRNYRVTEIGWNSFNRCQSLTTVFIPNTVTTIGENAFGACFNLSAVNIPESVTTIEDYAFQACGFTDLNLPESVTHIGEYAFYLCDHLKEITIPKFITSIKPFTFMRCTSASIISIPASVTKIGDSAFALCNGLQKIYVAAKTAPKIEETTFTDYSATLYVPEESVEKYKSHPVWSKFANIEGFDVTGIEDVRIGADLIEDSTTVVVYNLSGTAVYKGVFGAFKSNLSPGIYIVRSATTTKKIAVK